MNVKINPNPLSVNLHNFRDFFMSIGWAQVIGWVWSPVGARFFLDGGFKLEQFTNKKVLEKWEYRMIPWLVN